MSILELAATLCGEPWYLTPQQVGKLTMVQVQEVYFRHRDKNGAIRRDPDRIADPKSPRQEFIDRWARWGLSRERAAELWVEKGRKDKEAKAAKKAARKEKANGRKR